MLLRSSISNTKKFLQKTLHNLMSFFSPGYQKIPKTPLPNHFLSINMDNNDQSYKDLDKFYDDFTKQWDSANEKNTRRRTRNKKKPNNLPLSSQPMQEKEELHNDDHKMEKIEEHHDDDEKQNDIKRRLLTHQKGIIRPQEYSSSSSSLKLMNSKGNGGMVEKKLREMEMLDISNVDYVLDIEEVLHYYSRLTSPAYLEIVDKFFLEMYSEFFGGTVVPRTPSVNSRMKLRPVKS